MVSVEAFGDRVMSLAEAAEWFERRFGRRPHTASIWRWATKGVKGVKLETISMGRYRYTTSAALEKFVSETSIAGPSVQKRGAAFSGTTAAPAGEKFSAADVAAAGRRRQEEQARALQYLQSRLGTATRGTAQ